MKALVLCAGLGTRLRPFTFSTAKHLLPIANKPVLHSVIENLVCVGATQIGIVVSPESRPLIETAIQDGAKFGAQVTYIMQMRACGLADACAGATDFIGNEPFIVHLGDCLLPEGLVNATQCFREAGANAVIVLKPVDDPRRFGVAEVEAGRIVRLVEKPDEPRSDLAIVGVYLFDHHIWESIGRIKPSRRDEYEITDAIQDLIDHDLQVIPFVAEGRWTDMGKPEDLLDANRAMLDGLDALLLGTIDATSKIDGTVSIAVGARVIASTIRGPVVIGANTLVENAQIGPHVSLGEAVRVSGATLKNCVVMDGSEVLNLETPLVDSVIGRNAKVRGKHARQRLLLGDCCEVDV